MTTGRYPFEGDNVYRLLEAIGRGEPAPPPTTLGPTLGALLSNMLKRDPELRPNVQEIRRHAWVHCWWSIHYINLFCLSVGTGSFLSVFSTLRLDTRQHLTPFKNFFMYLLIDVLRLGLALRFQQSIFRSNSNKFNYFIFHIQLGVQYDYNNINFVIVQLLLYFSIFYLDWL